LRCRVDYDHSTGLSGRVWFDCVWPLVFGISDPVLCNIRAGKCDVRGLDENSAEFSTERRCQRDGSGD
jgi:hypothetical protein